MSRDSLSDILVTKTKTELLDASETGNSPVCEEGMELAECDVFTRHIRAKP